MEVVNFEKFLYFNKCELTATVNGSKKIIEKQKLTFLFTLTNLYFFGEHPENKSKGPEDIELEKNLVCKFSHDQFYLNRWDDQLRCIDFFSRKEEVQITMEIKDFPTKDFRDFVNICLIIDGYKIITEGMNLEYSSYLDYLLYLVENLIINTGNLLIEEDFFEIDLNFLITMAYFFTRIERYIVKVNLSDKNFIELFIKIFYNDDESTKFLNINYQLTDGMPSSFPKLCLLKVLKFVDNNLDDEGFEMLNKIFEQTEFLTELEISKNHISYKSLTKLSTNMSKGLRMLEKLILANNWIDSYNLHEFVICTLENLSRLNFLDLSGNFIDNEFLKKFEMDYLRKNYQKIEFNDVLIDLTHNRFDTHLMRKNFHLWKPEEEFERIERGIYTLSHFMINITTMKIKLKIKVDMVKHYEEIKDREQLKKIHDASKCVKIFSRSVIGIQPKNLKNEIQEYIDIFELFYLIDQFFDPNLNNFNVKDINQNINLSSGYLNSSNINEYYNILRNIVRQNFHTSNNLNYFSNNNKLAPTHNYIGMIVANNYYESNREKIIAKFFNKIEEDFSPNTLIEDLNEFYTILKNSSLEFPLSTLHKYINRIKIETLLALKDKDIYSINFLSELCSYFRISYMEKIDSELSSLQERSKIIMKGLKAALNFEGNQMGHRYFYHEINNFYDIFIKEADSINLKNDIVYAAKYIQFVRNNILRSKLFTIYENILKEENLFSGIQNISSEFDLIYKKYKDFDDYTKLRIPEEVKIKSLALHPLKLDYLKICEVLLSDLGSDLKLVSVKLAEEESYGIRNIHDRIHFFLSATSDEYMEKNNKYILHKQNNFLKVTRILFRFFNNIDLATFKDNFMIDYVVLVDTKEKEKENYSMVDRNSIVNYSKIKIMSNEDKLKKLEKSAKEILDYKKKILSYESNPIKESILQCPDELKNEDQDQFKNLSLQINEKLYDIFDKNFSEDGTNILNLTQLCRRIKNFINYFQDIKEEYQSTNHKFYESFNHELILQLYRHGNRNEFSVELKITQYVLGLLLILSTYLEVNQNFMSTLKKWMNYLISKHYYEDYFKIIQKNLSNHDDNKILWIPSIFEIENRLENQEIYLALHFGKRKKESFKITKLTTITHLFESIIEESKYFMNVIEKKMYWIYVKHININECVPVFNEEYVLELISFLEDNYLNNLEMIQTSSAVINTVPTCKEDFEVHNDKGSFESRPINDLISLGSTKSKNAKQQSQLMSSLSKADNSFIFSHIKFIVQRRLYSPIIIFSQFNSLHENEIYIIYEQIKNHFIKQEYSIVVADGDTINLCAVLFEILKRTTLDFNNNLSIESNLDINLNRILPKFKKNIINNNLNNFITHVSKNIKEKNLAIKSEKDLKEEFLRLIKNYEIFYSSIYSVKLKSSNISNQADIINLPEKFLIMITLNYFIFLDHSRYEPILKFNYYDLIHCSYVTDNLHLAVILLHDNGIKNELRLKLIADDSRLIMEDILSYCQLYLAINTTSNLTNCKNISSDQEIVIEFKPALCDFKDYKLIYQKKLPQLNIIHPNNNEPSYFDNNSSNRRSSVLGGQRKSILNKSSVLNRSPSKQSNVKKNTSQSNFMVPKNISNSADLSANNGEIKSESVDEKDKKLMEEKKNNYDKKLSNPSEKIALEEKKDAIEGILKKNEVKDEDKISKRVSFIEKNNKKDDKPIETNIAKDDDKNNISVTPTQNIAKNNPDSKDNPNLKPLLNSKKTLIVDSYDSNQSNGSSNPSINIKSSNDISSNKVVQNDPLAKKESKAQIKTKKRIGEAISMVPFKNLTLKNSGSNPEL